MADMMTFPDTVEEFMEQYKITDTEQIYTNGTELVPIFRMRQWFDHKPEPHWIPCSERLPEEGCHVLMCGADGVIRIGRMGTNLFWVGTKVTTAVAWMPLPEPYRGGDSE